jgi:phospholipid/cholesterol/gamma-HCH transport system ATP-binding protein
MVFQYSALLDSMTILENVAFPLREHSKLKDKEIRAKVTDKLHALGLKDVERRFPSELSGGMRKRVALARALMLEPRVILYDEPTSGLDPITSRKVDDMILETRDKFGVTSVVISHDMTSALHIADNIHLLAEGRIVTSGTAQEIGHSDHELVKKFIQSSGIATDHLLEARKARPARGQPGSGEPRNNQPQ